MGGVYVQEILAHLLLYKMGQDFMGIICMTYVLITKYYVIDNRTLNKLKSSLQVLFECTQSAVLNPTYTRIKNSKAI